MRDAQNESSVALNVGEGSVDFFLYAESQAFIYPSPTCAFQQVTGKLNSSGPRHKIGIRLAQGWYKSTALSAGGALLQITGKLNCKWVQVKYWAKQGIWCLFINDCKYLQVFREGSLSNAFHYFFFISPHRVLLWCEQLIALLEKKEGRNDGWLFNSVK